MDISILIASEDEAGTSIAFAGSSIIPFGYLPEDGRAVSKILYARLYESIGDTYGVHSDPTMFYIPDSRGRVNVATSDINKIGQITGLEAVVLLEENLPSHNHTSTPHNHTYPNYYLNSSRWASDNKSVTAPVNGTSTTNPTNVSLQNSGDSEPHNNMSPFLVITRLIKY